MRAFLAFRCNSVNSESWKPPSYGGRSSQDIGKYGCHNKDLLQIFLRLVSSKTAHASNTWPSCTPRLPFASVGEVVALHCSRRAVTTDHPSCRTLSDQIPSQSQYVLSTSCQLALQNTIPLLKPTVQGLSRSRCLNGDGKLTTRIAGTSPNFNNGEF